MFYLLANRAKNLVMGGLRKVAFIATVRLRSVLCAPMTSSSFFFFFNVAPGQKAVWSRDKFWTGSNDHAGDVQQPGKRMHVRLCVGQASALSDRPMVFAANSVGWKNEVRGKSSSLSQRFS